MGLFDHDLRNDIKKYREYHEYLIEECKRYVQDTTIDLDERWRFFINDAIGKENQSWIWHPEDNEVDKVLKEIYNDGWIDRHQIIDLTDLVPQAFHDGQLTKSLYDRARECMLEEYIDSFIYDW